MNQFRQPKGQPQMFSKLKRLTNKQFWDNLFLSFPPQYSDTASENLESSESVHPLKGPLGPKPGERLAIQQKRTATLEKSLFAQFSSDFTLQSIFLGCATLWYFNIVNG